MVSLLFPLVCTMFLAVGVATPTPAPLYNPIPLYNVRPTMTTDSGGCQDWYASLASSYVEACAAVASGSANLEFITEEMPFEDEDPEGNADWIRLARLFTVLIGVPPDVDGAEVLALSMAQKKLDKMTAFCNSNTPGQFTLHCTDQVPATASPAFSGQTVLQYFGGQGVGPDGVWYAAVMPAPFNWVTGPAEAPLHCQSSTIANAQSGTGLLTWCPNSQTKPLTYENANLQLCGSENPTYLGYSYYRPTTWIHEWGHLFWPGAEDAEALDLNGNTLPAVNGEIPRVYGFLRSAYYARKFPGGVDAGGMPTGALLTPEPLALWCEAARFGQYDWTKGCPSAL